MRRDLQRRLKKLEAHTQAAAAVPVLIVATTPADAERQEAELRASGQITDATGVIVIGPRDWDKADEHA